METIGIKDPFLLTDFKQLLLYFDVLYITPVEISLLKFRYDCFPDEREEIEQRIRNIEYLISIGQIKEFDGTINKIIKNNPVFDKRVLADKNFQKSIGLFNSLHDDFEEKSGHLITSGNYSEKDFENIRSEMSLLGNVESRLKARMLSEIKKRSEVMPIVDAFCSSEIGTKTRLVNIVIEKFPIPSEIVPWEAIIDFRDNLDSKNKKNLLLSWINQMATKPIGPKEFQLELDILINEYEEELKRNKVTYQTGIFKTLIKLPLTTVEKLFRIKFSELVDPIFNIYDGFENLLKIESKATNKQVGYIVKSKNKFN